MENYTFKSVTFGGFAKEDVVNYIEQASREAAAVQEKLQQENDGLREQVRALSEAAAELEAQVKALSAEKRRLEEALSRETAARQALEPLKAETERLAAEAARLRPDAEAYAQFRERIGGIECEARKRAADLEAETVARMEAVAETFRAQYQALMSSFDATAAHVTGELRKVEVNLSQLPRAMDRAGTEWEALSALLERAKHAE